MSRFGQPEMPKVSAETRAAFSQDLLLKAQRKMERTNKRAEFKDRLEKAAQEAALALTSAPDVVDETPKPHKHKRKKHKKEKDKHKKHKSEKKKKRRRRGTSSDSDSKDVSSDGAAEDKRAEAGDRNERRDSPDADEAEDHPRKKGLYQAQTGASQAKKRDKIKQ